MNRWGVKGVFDVIPCCPKALFLLKNSSERERSNSIKSWYLVDAARSSGILKAKQKLGRTFDSDKLGGIAFKKNSKMTMRSAYEEAQTIVPASTGQHQHCTCSVLKIL